MTVSGTVFLRNLDAGERDIHKKVLDLPIPRCNSKKAEHQTIADLGGKARRAVGAFLSAGELPSSLALGRQVLRAHISDLTKKNRETQERDRVFRS